MQKPELFSSSKEFVVFSVFLLLLLVMHLASKYYSYQTFISKPFYYTAATVMSSYEKIKKNKRYKVLKLKSDEGFTFYTTTHRKEHFNNKYLRLQIFPNESIGFKDYLGTFYVKCKIKNQKKLPLTFKNRLLNYVAKQHKDSTLKTFYNAIFFATPLDRTLREKIVLLGVSHLVALSGFHLGILWGLIYGFLLLLYRPLQQKYFPYRHALFDVGIVAMSILGLYVWFVNFPPSLVRSFTMVLVGWSVLLLGMELLSFTFLVSIFLLLCVAFPYLLVSLSFWFSIAGVFYIFLLLQYIKEANKWMISLLYIPLGIFLLMLPVVHGVFGVTSSYQLLSPLLSMLFVPFYPLTMLLHLWGMGDMLDSALLWLLNLPQASQEHFVPWWATLLYVMLSIGAIWKKRVFYAVVTLAFIYGAYIFIHP